MRFGNSNDNETSCKVSLDSCVGLNIGNLSVHQWIATTHPQVVRSWIDFDDKDRFEPLALNCAVEDRMVATNNNGKLTAMVSCYTRYLTLDKMLVIVSFGLGKDVAVNAIIG